MTDNDRRRTTVENWTRIALYVGPLLWMLPLYWARGMDGLTTWALCITLFGQLWALATLPDWISWRLFPDP